MYLVTQLLILLFAIYLGDAGYGVSPQPGYNYGQSDVEAPAYVPPYAKNQYYSGTKTGGTKTSYSGTKTSYGGTKTSYSGTKTSYSGTKTGQGGTKTAYGGTSYTGSYPSYGESGSWYSNYGAAPSYSQFQNNAHQTFMPNCEPACQNSGICVDTNTCQCPINFHGTYCEFEKKPCLTYPPLPMNSNRRCSSDMCTFTCMPDHSFIDGSTIANMRCVEGQWQPTRADLTTLPDCQPECKPACMNGGVCLSVNTCQCPDEFRGPQCQYSTDACDVRKLSFNGEYSCFGDSDTFSCVLSCPPGTTYSSAPAELYTCLYSTGVFDPPAPHCVYPDVVIVRPGSHRHNMSHSESTTQLHQQTMGESQSHSHQETISGGGGISSTQGSHGSYHYGGHPVTLVVQDLTPKGGTCLTWAGVHYKTFDGMIYSFQSPCKHVLVRDAKERKYSVEVKHGVCVNKAHCPSELTIYLEDKFYVLAVGEDGSVVFRNSKRLIPIPAALPGIRVSMPSDHVLVNLDSAGVSINWDTNNMILVEGSVLLWNSTEGLCGLLDGNPQNDLRTRDGTVAQTKAVLAAAWKVDKIGDVCESNPTETSACSSLSDTEVKKAQQFCTKIFGKEKFRKCSQVMDVSLLLETCQWDYCACTSTLSPEECGCSTVAVYAKECLRHGVEDMKTWRDDETCPMKCPQNKVYKACGPDFQPSCLFPQPPATSSNSSCVEGCFCPDGLLLEEGRCVPQNECPCRLKNRNFKPGKTVKRDCNTCKCEGGAWTCTQLACGARCGAVGDPHYSTFDGLRYDFMGHCTYTMLKTDNFTVDVENVACSGAITEAMNLSPYKGEGKPSCTKAVTLKHSGAVVHMQQGGFILVDGREVTKLPVMVGGIRIRAASSLFVIVQMPNKVDLWWDGNTRVFIDVPAEFQGKTQGLCGTFNLNQKDDFLTPENDVEQSALAFANKWKTREFCSDIETKEPEHPCKANMENKDAAERYCSKLKSNVFQACHWDVDVEPYYEACVYDMCACAGDVSRCLCPILGDYAMTCAKAGVIIQWRYNVDECELQCTGGQEYTVCADSCLRKCSDTALAASGTCKPSCVEGCACPVGQLLDDNGLCVPTGLCPCFHKGLQFNSGYKEIRAGRRERELCTCVGARWDCKPATPEEIQNYPPAEDIRSNCSATNNMEFTTCEIAEPLTCKNMHLPPTSTTAECRPGCQCKKGYVLDIMSKKCVLPAQCPCHHGGRSYPDGHHMQEECNTCECKSGTWSCTSRKCAGVCSAWGDSHIVTFDGTDYDFEGVCTYLLAKGVMDSNDGFDVEIQNVPCGTTGATCSKSVTLKVGRGPSEEIVTLTKDVPIPDISKLKRIKLRIAGAYVFLDVPSLGMSLQWDREMRVYVKVDSIWQGRVKGLCGNYNADMRDDFQTPSGGGIAESSVLIFADSWKLKPTCPKPQRIIDHCNQRPERKEWAEETCGAMKRYPFTLCHAEVPPAPYIARCTRDACACDAGGDCRCACAALAHYAHACAHRGVTFKWRTQDMCPMQCDEECSNYDACVSPCPVETCDNTLYYAEMKINCIEETCVEGCKPKKSCPEGEVYKNSSHKECVPRAKCKPVCMTLEDGREVGEGEVVEEDQCHTCRCSKKHTVCTGQPCSTVSPVAPGEDTTPHPHDEPLKCVSGWTNWINRGPPEVGPLLESIDNEPLPKPNELTIGSPMCKQKMMTKIECRTVGDHKSPKDTGLDVECSLERGLVCRETNRLCLDFEIRVYCECEEHTPCENSVRPNEPHPTNCSQFYECAPEGVVLKDCGPGTWYNPVAMVCDWPASVVLVRPECAVTTQATEKTTVPTTTAGQTTVTPLPSTTRTPLPSTTTKSVCPPGQVYSDCAYRCDKLCDSFRKTLLAKGRCITERCVEGCVKPTCDADSYWRDENTCVPMRDCTCLSDNKIIKPGGVVVDGCIKCQCLNNNFHCDSSECVMVSTPYHGSTHQPIIVPHILPTPSTTTTSTNTTTTTTTTTTTARPVVVTSPVPECTPDKYVDLLFGDQPVPESSFSASSVASALYQPQYAKLNGHPLDVSAGSWNPKTQDRNQYIQVELPRREPIYGVKMQGSPLFSQYVTSYQVLYGDDKDHLAPVTGPDGTPKVFTGCSDNNNPHKEMFDKPIEAKVIRIRPLTWHEEIAVRFELIGCREPTSTITTPTTTSTTTVPTTVIAPLIITTTVSPPPECNPDRYVDLLFGDQPLSESAFSASSVASALYQPQYAKLNGHPLDVSAGSWNPKTQDRNQYIQVELPRREPIYGVKLQGSPLFSQYVTSYQVLYGDDKDHLAPVTEPDGTPKVFTGCSDNNNPHKEMFDKPIEAKVIRIRPLTWHEEIAVRFELIGCREPTSTITTPTTTSTTTVPTTVIAPLIITTTVSPPPECNPDSYLDLMWGDQPLPDSAFSASSSASHLYEPRNAKLNGHPTEYTAGSWNPAVSDRNQYIQVELPRREPIYGVKMQGSPLFDHYVTSYQVLYGDDGVSFSTVNGPDGTPKVFRGPVDHNTVMKQMFEPPLDAKIVRIKPLTWHEEIAVRIELIGCQEPLETSTTELTTVESLQCDEPLGLAAGLPVQMIEVSSNNEDRKYFTLEGSRGWRPLYSTPGEWIMFNFTSPRNITGIKTKGGPKGWVTTYKILYTSDLSTFNPVVDSSGSDQLFPANYDQESTVMNQFHPPIHAQYFKVLPITWNNNIELKVEPIGCFEPYPATTPPPVESSTGQYREPMYCSYCPGVQQTSSICRCAEPTKYYDGENCVTREQCPCVHSFMSYPVGSIFRGSNCDECVCKLGGITDCSPVKECKCAKDLVPKLSPSTCECLCEACPSGTKICPTSKLCLALHKWCDGLQDCPDDERDCTTTTTVTTPTPLRTTVVTEAPVVTTQHPTVAAVVTTPAPKRNKITTRPISRRYGPKNFFPRSFINTFNEERSLGEPGNRIRSRFRTKARKLKKSQKGIPNTKTPGSKKNESNKDRFPAVVCPKVECPPGYTVVYTQTTQPSRPTYNSLSDLPPPRPRYSYQRYYSSSKGGYTKGGYSKGGYSKTGYSKGGASKGGYGLPPAPRPNQAFSLNKPALNTSVSSTTQACAQFRCIPKLPPYVPGVVVPPPVCSVVNCPQGYTLKLDTAASLHSACPQYTCVPPPERQVFCNVTGRTFNTFDGTEYKYDICYHVLARENRFDAWAIFIRKKCSDDGCRNELLVLQDDQLITVKPNMMIEYDNYEYTVEQTSKICFQKNSFDVAQIGNGISIKSRKYNFTVLYTSEGDIKIGVYKKYMGSVDGLCGAFDGNPSNDRRTPGGQVTASIEQFGRSWAKPGLSPTACQTRVISDSKQRRAWELCDAITKEPLSQCARVLDLNKWRSICLEKICECTELVVNGTHRTEEECRCLLVQQMVAECLAADKDLDLSPWRIQLDCPAECPAPLVHYECYRARCEPTCSSLGVLVPRACPIEDGQCFPGCYCPEGKLRKGDLCVLPADCLDCTCNGVGSPAKYVTFEGDDLPFLANCTYLASRDRNQTGQHKYQVYSTNGPCEDSDAVCTNTVHLLYEKNVVHVTKDHNTNKLITSIGNTAVYKFPLKNEWVTINQVNGKDISIALPDIHVELTVLQSKMEFRVQVPSYLYANQTEGLCGVCAGYQDTLITSNGTATDDFDLYGKSWQATPEILKTLDISEQAQCEEVPPPPACVIPPPESNPCYNLYNADRFGVCHALVDPEPFVSSCSADVCANVTDACGAMQRYVAECRRQGVCLDNWRTDLCPYHCAAPLVYRGCVDCERTCDNYAELTTSPDMCIEQPAEGCFCPEGKVRVNNTCIEPSKCFPCDANKEHYAGDEWQEDACTKCTCSKLKGENTAHVSCTKQTCVSPVCSLAEDMITQPAKPGHCCTEYLCIPKPVANCTEPKSMDCGFGQVLKQKTTPEGCKEFACECMPASECQPIPPEDSVEIVEPGMNRLVDRSGCCPRVQYLCRKDTCPQPPSCEQYYELKVNNDSGKCCPQYTCELPKNKCIVKLEWEAASKGGEKPRTTPQTVLKDVDSVWLDGPCRSCTCTRDSSTGHCTTSACAPVLSTSTFVLEPRPVPFQCCPTTAYVACIDGDNIYKVGENWTRREKPCESYKCVRTETGDKLEKITTLQTCSEDCQPGWKYFPAAADSGECCGKCEPVACVVDGQERLIGEKWTSTDFCANYTCVNLDGTLQVQCSNETCPEVSEAVKKQFVLKREKVEGKCCPIEEPVACRVGDKIYQEGQTWSSPDPCKNMTCSRDVTGRLTHSESVTTCHTECKRGWLYLTPSTEQCCGRCVPDQCVVEEQLYAPGSTWQSADNCTTFSCDKLGEDVYVTSSRQACPDVSQCAPEHLVNDTCCQLCEEPPQALSKCVPQAIPSSSTVGQVRVHLGPHGVCVNSRAVSGLRDCVGNCDSGTSFNNMTGTHDSVCTCCSPLKYDALVVQLQCADGTQQPHKVATPKECGCSPCGGVAAPTWKRPVYSGTKTAQTRRPETEDNYEIPEIYQRFGTERPIR